MSNMPGKCISVGTFDGCHLGHQFIISELLAAASQFNLPPAIVTFWPHPRMVVGPQDEPIYLLQSLEEKIAFLHTSGILDVIVIPFDTAFSQMPAESFIRLLKQDYHLEALVVGYDHQFGKGREGSFDLVSRLSKDLGFHTIQTQSYELDGVVMSSSKIRTLIQEGDIKSANTYLGRPYSMSGTVVRGKQLGRTLGYPTANMQLDVDYKVIPKHGVYQSYAIIDGERLPALTSVGTNPTLQEQALSIETFIFDLDRDLYGKKIVIEYLVLLREQLIFASLRDLQLQMSKDEQLARSLFHHDI